MHDALGFEKEFKRMEAEIETLKCTIEAKDSENAGLKLEVETLRAYSSSCSRTADSTKAARIAELEKEVAVLEETLREELRQSVEILHTNEACMKELKAQETTRDMLEAKVAALGKDNLELTKRLRVEEDSGLQTALCKLGHLAADSMEHQDHRKDHAGGVDHKTPMQPNANNDGTNVHTNQSTQQNTQPLYQKEHYQSMQSLVESQERIYGDRIQTLEARIRVIETERQELKEILTLLATTKNEMESQIAILIRSGEEKDLEINNLQKLIYSLQTVGEEMKAALTFSETTKNEMESSIVMSRRGEEDKELECAKLTRVLASCFAREHIDAHIEALRQLQAQHERLLVELEGREKQITIMEEHLQTGRQERQELKGILTHSASTKNEMQEQIAHLRSAGEEKDLEINNLRNRIYSLQTVGEEMKAAMIIELEGREQQMAALEEQRQWERKEFKEILTNAATRDLNLTNQAQKCQDTLDSVYAELLRAQQRLVGIRPLRGTLMLSFVIAICDSERR
jgi:chromosome segregation ATPase